MIVALTGHRYLAFKQTPFHQLDFVKTELRKYYLELQPVKILSGGAIGFDLIGAEIAHELQIPFDLVLPFEGQEKRWPIDLQQKYHQLKDKAQQVIFVSPPGYDYWKMHARNQYLVDHSDLMIACFDGKREGGTFHCLKYAQKQKKEIISIDPIRLKSTRATPHE